MYGAGEAEESKELLGKLGLVEFSFEVVGSW